MVRIPTATYRLQLRPSFGFDEAAQLVPYLDLLGITDLYTSPILTARPGSRHGYDVIDHSRLNPELGGAEAFERLSDALHKYEMGLLVDVVPGYMSSNSPLNGWWTDVLENGRSSPFALAFDIDWHSPNPGLVDRVLLPILGEQYGRVLEAGELRVEHQNGSFWLRYQHHQLPLDPRTWSHVLEPAVGLLRATGDPAGAHELGKVVTGLKALPARDELQQDRVQERQRKKAQYETRLMALLDSSPGLRSAIDRSLESLNGHPGDPRSFDDLDELLAAQAFRVAHWRVASEEINYRRFRDVNELASLRVEEPRVFDAVHEVIFDLVREGRITGLRIDAVDGLLDPLAYLREVQARCRTVSGRHEVGRSIYLLVDKILSGGEELPAEWPVHGTTGYDFLNRVGGVFIDQQGSHALLEHYIRLTHQRELFSEVAWECKKLALGRGLGSQFAMLSRRLFLISEQQRHSRDFTAQDLGDALEEVLACFPVYRTYLPGEGALSEVDRRQIDAAVAQAQQTNPALPSPVFDFVRSVMAQEHPPELSEAQREERRDFALRLQQLTAAMMGQAIENTACYRFYPLASSGEVSADREFPSVSIAALHQHNLNRLERYPHGMLATSTHHTKRGEDVAARIRALSRLPGAWAAAFERFHLLNQRHCAALPAGHAPDANEEYLFYQTLLGLWPFEPMTSGTRGELSDRLCAYMTKVLREAKVHSSWVNPNEAWENAVTDFVKAVMLPATSDEFLSAFQAFAEPITRSAVWSSLGQLLLKITCPGVPDFYQGSELWDLNLVDPDNQRPVDFALRDRLLRELLSQAEENTMGLLHRLVLEPGDGRLKLYVTQRALAARRARRVVFEQGSYLPLEATGPQADRVVAFARTHEEKTFLIVTGRFFTAHKAHERPPVGEEAWGGTRLWLPPGSEGAEFRDVFTGLRWTSEEGALRLSEVFTHLPVAMLESK